MELGHAFPTARECIAFRAFFRQSFEELWPRLGLEVEARTFTNIRRLIVRLGRQNVQSVRKRVQINIIRKNLVSILADFRKKQDELR
jgi:hypothetical protein